MSKKTLFSFMLLLSVTLAACNVAPPAPSANGPDGTDLIEIVSQTQTAMAPSDTSGRPAAGPVSTPVFGDEDAVPLEDVRACVEAAQAAPIPAGLAFDALPQAVEIYLNAGGSPFDLEDQLQAMGLAMPPVGVANGDFDADDRRDVAVALMNPQAAAVNPSGILIVFLCRQDRLVPVETRSAPEGFSGPHMLHLRDLDADRGVDLVVRYDSCGAHTCFSEPEILSWNGSGLENRLVWELQGGVPGMQSEVVDLQGNGIYDLVLTAAGVGSVGAGPQREETWIYTLDPEVDAWTLSDQMSAAAQFRIHAVHDADELLLEGQFQPALDLFSLVIDDPDLQAWGDPAFERPFLSGYARFKRVVVLILQGDLQSAQAEYERLATDYPEPSPGHAWTQLGAAFWQAFSAGGDLAQGCVAARHYAEQHPAEILEPLYFGYANPQYTPVEICPW